jgi:hypothetical protein
LDTTAELRINRDIKVLATAKGLAIHLTFAASGQQQDILPIELSRAQAIQVGGDIANGGSSDRIPIAFEPGDASAFGKWLMRFAADAVYQNPPKFQPLRCFPCNARKSLSSLIQNILFVEHRASGSDCNSLGVVGMQLVFSDFAQIVMWRGMPSGRSAIIAPDEAALQGKQGVEGIVQCMLFFGHVFRVLEQVPGPRSDHSLRVGNPLSNFASVRFNQCCLV